MSKKIIKSKLFLRTFFSYILMLIFPIIIFTSISYYNNLQTLKQETIKKQEVALKKFTSLIDGELLSLRNAASEVASLSWVWKLSAEHTMFLEQFTPMKKKEIINDLNLLFKNTSFDMTIFFPQKDVTVSSKGWFSIDSYLSSLGVGIDVDRIKEDLKVQHQFSLLYQGTFNVKGRPYIFIMSSIDPMLTPRAQVIFTIDVLAMQSYMEKIAPAGFTDIKIMDRNKAPLLAIKADPPKSNSKVYSQQFASEDQSLHYDMTTCYPAPTLTPSAVLFLLLSAFVCMLIGPSLAYCLATLSYNPLKKMLFSISDDNSTTTQFIAKYKEFSEIEERFNRLKNDKKNTEMRITEYSQYVQNDLLIRLTKGIFIDNGVEQKLSYYGINYSNENQFAVIVIANADSHKRPADFEFNNTIQNTIKIDTVLSCYYYEYRIISALDDDVTVILSDKQAELEKDSLEKIMEDLQTLIEQSQSVKAKIYFGGIEQGLLGISKSFQQARELLSISKFAENNYRTYCDATRFYYPTDWEMQLINNLKMGKRETVERIISEIRNENEQRNLTNEMMIALAKSVCQTLTRVSVELNLTWFFDEVNSQLELAGNSADKESLDSIEKYWEYIEVASHVIYDRTAYSDTLHPDVAQQMLDYINNNFDDIDLSLKKIADDLHISQSAASKAFKNKTGINFHEYFSRLRMEKAKLLLANPKYSVKTICSEVGYDNEYSFRRSFLRQEGISVSEYRKNNAK